MTFPASFVDHPVSQAVAWALVHFVWQGALIGLAAFAALRLFRLAPPARYAAGIAALLVMAAAPIATTVVMLGDGRPAEAATASLTVSSAPAGLSDPIEAARFDAIQPAAGMGAAVPAARRLPFESIVLVAWFLGVAVLSLRLLGGWIVARRLTHRSVRPASPDLQSLAQRIAGRLALDRVVRVVESSAVAVPMLVGWLKPVVLLPASALSGLTPTQVEALLAHELAHVRRHDYLVNLLQSVVETLLFYHPAVWWVSRQVRREREHCCDDLAVGVCDRLEYVTALASLAAMTAPPQPALAATDGSLVGRVRRLLSPDVDERPSSMAGWVAVSLIVLGAVLAARSVPEAAEPGILDEQAPAAATQPVSQAAATPAQGGSPAPASQSSSGVAVAAGPAQGARGGVATVVTGGVATGVAGGVSTGVAGGVATGVTSGRSAGVAAAAQDPDKVRAIREAEQELRRAQREIEMRRIELDLERAKIEASVQLEAAASQIEILKRQVEKTKQMVDVGLATPETQASLEAQLAAAHQQLKMAEADLRLRERDIALRVREAEARALYEQRMVELDVARLSRELAQAGTAIEATAVREAATSARAVEAAARAAREADVERAVELTQLQRRLAEIEVARASDPEQARRIAEEQYRDVVERYGRLREAVMVDAAEPAQVDDSIDIEIAGEPDLPRRHTVQADGTIRLPFLGSVRVLGLTAGQIREAVARQLSARNLMADPAVTVTIRRPVR